MVASMQRTNSSLMVVSQWTTKPRVVAEQQTNTCPRVISAQWTDSGLMAMLQRMAKPRVVVNRRTYLILQATSTQQTGSDLMAMLQWMTMPSPVTKSACPYRQNTPRLRKNTSHIPEKRKFEIIFEGPHEVRSGRRA